MFTEITCTEPAAGQNVVITNGAQGPYIARHTISYRCSQGYKTEDYLTITCQENGQWNRPAPNCQGKTKAMLEVFRNWKVPRWRPFPCQGYYVLCSFRACKSLVVTASDMTTETRVISIVLSLKKANILKATTMSSFIKRHGRFLNNSRGFFILYILLG